MKPVEVTRFWEANAENWTRLVRSGFDLYRDKLNTQAFLAMLPDVRGLHGLDIGCGEGANTRKLARLGARMKGVDVARGAICHAQATESAAPLGILYQVSDGTRLPFAGSTFDFAAAFMALMDMPDHGRALKEAARVLRPGGFFQFSVLHPCIAVPHRRVLRDRLGNVLGVEVGSCSESMSGRKNEWRFPGPRAGERREREPLRTPVFHRTLSSWVDLIGAAGLVIEKMGEPIAMEEEDAFEPIVADTRTEPLFLQVRVRKSM
jgi:SAM-dependent methyltransferase